MEIIILLIIAYIIYWAIKTNNRIKKEVENHYKFLENQIKGLPESILKDLIERGCKELSTMAKIELLHRIDD